MKKFLMTTAIAACMALPAVAQSTDPATGTDTTGGTTMTEPNATSNSPMFTAGSLDMSADTLVGKNVYIQREGIAPDASINMTAGIEDAPDTWDNVGEVGDVMIDAQGSVSSIVVDAGGFLGLGERNVSVALTDLQFVPDTNDDGAYFVVYTGDRTRLEATDEYNRDAMEGEGYRSLDTYRTGNAAMDATGTDQAAAPAAEGGISDTTTAQSGDTMARPDREGMTAAAPEALTAENLTGARVYGASDDWVGEISQLVLSDDGKIENVIIDVGGWLGMGERPVALSMDQIDIRSEGDNGDDIVIYVDYSEDELKAMPEWKS